MKVVCINNQYSALSADLQLVYACNHIDLYPTVDSITIFKTYIVYAAASFKGYPGYFICDDQRSYPLWYSSEFFNMVDPRFSRYWIASIKEDRTMGARLFLGFPEWANEELFYNNLIEGEERELSLFKKYQQLMDLEFPDSAITQVAQIGDENWLICASCIDAWQNSDVRDALVICSKCCETFCNPRYKDVFPGII